MTLGRDSQVECSIWALQIPAVNVDFVGMSLYFFVVDFVRAAFALPEEAPLSIEDLKSYGRAFCALPWEFRFVGSLNFREVKSRFRGVHQYTNDQVLPQRCFQVGLRAERQLQIAYVVTLLEQGYRLEEGEQNAVSIDFLRKINGESVDWTYGAALFMVGEDAGLKGRGAVRCRGRSV